MASRKGTSSRRARVSRSVQSQRAAAAGQRTLLHLALQQSVVDDVDTLLWLRVTGAMKSVEAIRGGKNQIYDEAVERFLSRFERRGCNELKIRQATQGWRSLWVSTPLVERCKRIAERDGVSVGRVIGYALTSFLEETMKPSWRAFRADTAARASALLSSKR
jgi:hypothetical protein